MHYEKDASSSLWTLHSRFIQHDPRQNSKCRNEDTCEIRLWLELAPLAAQFKNASRFPEKKAGLEFVFDTGCSTSILKKSDFEKFFDREGEEYPAEEVIDFHGGIVDCERVHLCVRMLDFWWPMKFFICEKAVDNLLGMNGFLPHFMLSASMEQLDILSRKSFHHHIFSFDDYEAMSDVDIFV